MSPDRDSSLRGRFLVEGLLSAAWIAIASLPLLALLSRVGTGERIVAGFASALGSKAFRFGLEEALGSLFVSLAIGLPGAWLVANYRFPGRRLLRTQGERRHGASAPANSVPS